MKRLVWWVVSGLTILSLILAACAPAVTEKKKEEVTKKEVVTKEEVTKKEAVTEEKVTPGAEVPKYGGTFTLAINAWTVPFDEIVGKSPGMYPLHLINDELYEGDWTKGLAGTGESTFSLPIFPDPALGLWQGIIAESFEFPDDSTQVYHLRKGIHFHHEGPAKGRELDANDVAFSIDRQIKSPVSMTSMAYPPPVGLISATATDKWTVAVKTYPGKAGQNLAQVGDMMGIIAPEAVKKYGDLMQWEAAAAAGSGPYIMTDYIVGNSMSFKRNPDYWMKDPFHPENQLPYVDKVKMMIIYDKATRLAALRTGKLDVLGGSLVPILREDWKSLSKTNPELKWRKDLGAGRAIVMRVDKPELPWFDIRVRRALLKAVDRQTILKDYYEGDAELITILAQPIIEFKDMYMSLEEYPEHVQDLYQYDPKKAKELLAEAGYPNGFKAEVILEPAAVDELSMIAAYWAKIGVDLELQVKEVGAFTAISAARSHPQMLQSWQSGTIPHQNYHYRPLDYRNAAWVNDPICTTLDHRATSLWNVNRPEFVKVVKEELVRDLELAAYVYLPSPYDYVMWWPWVENYHGEFSVGYYTHPNYIKYIWLNPELKKETLAKR